MLLTLKLLPKLLDCWSVVLNISYLRMSASVTDRRAKRMASSKCSLISSGLTDTQWRPGQGYLHGDRRNIILVVLLVHDVDVLSARCLSLIFSLPISTNVTLDRGSNRQLGGSLTDFGEVGSRESSSTLGKEVEVNTRSQRRLAQSGGQNGDSRRFIRQRDVDELTSQCICRQRVLAHEAGLPDRVDPVATMRCQSGPVDLICKRTSSV